MPAKRTRQKIFPTLWFDNQGEEEAQYYIDLFSRAGLSAARREITRFTEAGKDIHGQQPGSAMTVDFELAGFRFTALNGGPHFQINPSISFFVMCEKEAEIDTLWNGLVSDGRVLMPLGPYPWSAKYGWLQDRSGLSWQVALGKLEDTVNHISTSLLFTGPQYGRAEEAMNHYLSVFKDSKRHGILYHEAGGTEKPGTVMHAQFYLHGQTFMVGDSGLEHDFNFNEAVSLVVLCQNQDEVDEYWEKLGAGGDPAARQCGWLKDKFGVSWQIIPERMFDLLDMGPEVSEKVLQSMFGMKKLIISEMEGAAGL